ncbi:MAG: VOC family protein [Bacteroidota bacterium]
MAQHLARIALVVDDYDEALAFYVDKLRFELVEDTRLDDQKRWVVVRPPGGSPANCSLLLAKGVGEVQRARIGDQTGGRVFLFLFTDDFAGDHAHLLAEGITIVRPPTDFPYGRVLVFADLYGNLWDLIQPSDTAIL